MENQVSGQVVAENSGPNNTTIVAGVIFIMVCIGVGYYFMGRSNTGMPALPNTNNNNQPIPGMPANTTPDKGSQAVGVLTDPNFFNGLTNFALAINAMVQQGKKNKKDQPGTTFDDVPSGNSYTPSAPAQTGGSVVLTGTTNSNNWGSW